MKIPNFQLSANGSMPDAIAHVFTNALLSFSGKKVRISIEEAKTIRSLDQNSYYWGVIVPHVRKVRFDMGDPTTVEQTHEDLLAQFAPSKEARKLNGETYERPMRSKEMSVNEMSQYVTAITACMAEFGHPVPMRDL